MCIINLIIWEIGLVMSLKLKEIIRNKAKWPMIIMVLASILSLPMWLDATLVSYSYQTFGDRVGIFYILSLVLSSAGLAMEVLLNSKEGRSRLLIVLLIINFSIFIYSGYVVLFLGFTARTSGA